MRQPAVATGSRSVHRSAVPSPTVPADLEEAHPQGWGSEGQPERRPERHVLLVGDAPGWRDDLTAWCRAEGYAVSVCSDAGGRLDDEGYDLAVVDLDRVPVEAVRAHHVGTGGSVPILATTALRQAEDLVVDAYGAGADQVVLGPLRQRELVARIRSLLRRVGAPRPPTVVVGATGEGAPGARPGPSADPAPARGAAVLAPVDDPGLRPAPISLDPVTRMAAVGDAAVALTAREAEVLRSLLARPGRVVTRADLAARDPDGHLPGAVDNVVRCLRTKLEAVEGHRRIVTVRGVGFRLLAPAPVPAPGTGTGTPTGASHP